VLIPYFMDADTTSLNLTSRFAAKENTIIAGTTGQYYRGDKTFQTLDKTAVGLGNVDNTSDANKPVSTATQTALNLKLNISDTASMLTNYLRTGVAASTYQAKLNGTGFVKASGTTISYDNSTYLTTGTAASTYLPLTGGTLTGDLYAKYLNTFAKTTYVPFNVGIGEQSIFNVGTALRGGTVMVFPDSTISGSSANVFLANSSGQGDEFSAMGSGIRNYTKQGGDAKRNSLALYTSGIGSQNTNRLFIDYDGNVGINDDTPSYKLDVNGTLGVTGSTTLSAPLTVNSSAVFNEGSTDSDFRVESDGNVNMVFVDASTDRVGIGTNAPTKTLDVNGEVRIATITATPTSLLGKDGSNVVGEVTTLTQTGLMKAGSTTTNTSSVGIITVAHGLSYTPTQVLVTLAQQNSYVIVCHGKNSTNLLFTVYDSVTGNALNNVSVGFFWLAIK